MLFIRKVEYSEKGFLVALTAALALLNLIRQLKRMTRQSGGNLGFVYRSTKKSKRTV